LIYSHDESEFPHPPHQPIEAKNMAAEKDFDEETDWLDLDTSDSEDDIALVSGLFQQISQETTETQDKPEDIAPDPEIVIPPLPIQKPQPRSPKIQKKYLVGIGLAIALGITGTLVVIYNRFSQQNSVITERDPLPIDSPSLTLPSTSPAEKFRQTDTPRLTQIATQRFAEGEVKTATAALEALLDRNALAEAKTVIAAISPTLSNTAEISFLRGRLIWQSLDSQINTKQIQAVRTLWQNAVKKQPNSVLYRNALGFAYYAEKNYDEAIAVWFDAITIEQEAKLQLLAQPAKKQVLNNYAGISLALWRGASSQTGEQKQKLVRESIKLGKKVLREAAIDFQPENLSQDWMWSKAAIQDWRTFLKEKALNSQQS
jgi:tetratricopeptide (TPR) repeat protein